MNVLSLYMVAIWHNVVYQFYLWYVQI